MKNLKILESEIRSTLLDENPGGVYIKELKNKDEYDFEITEIIKLFTEEMSEMVFVERVHKLFSESFGKTGKRQRYKIIAKKIWSICRKFN